MTGSGASPVKPWTGAQHQLVRVCMPRPSVVTVTPSASAVQPSIVSPTRSSAPRRRASSSCARTARLWANPPCLGLVVALGPRIGREHRKPLRRASSPRGFRGRRRTWHADPRVWARNRLPAGARMSPPQTVSSSIARLLLDLPPQLVRAADQRDVLGTLADRDPGDPRVAVRRSVRVRRLVGVDADHRFAAGGEPGAQTALPIAPSPTTITSAWRDALMPAPANTATGRS